MECYKIEGLSFTYPKREKKALEDINLSIAQGEFLTLCGKSGCGKTTLLRLLKSAIAPVGRLEGSIYFCDKPLLEVDTREQVSKIGFVLQNPDNQIVTDKVWHELAFGLESLGLSTPEIRTRVSEMASFFGIENWFHKNVTELSGGQKQLLNLASVMVMQPSVLILDEPTAQLDPIAAQEFLNTLKRINSELGTTVILSEHRLEDVFPITDRVVVMENGTIIADGTPQTVGQMLVSSNNEMYYALPAAMRVYGRVDGGEYYPVTVREGRAWLEQYTKSHTVNHSLIPKESYNNADAQTAVVINDAYFRYEKNLPDVIKGLSLKINKGEIFAIVGGNGAGKTTALSLISGINTPYRGEVLIYGKDVSKADNLYNGILGVLPQNPQALFLKKTVYLDLMEMLSEIKISSDEKDRRVKNISHLCRIDELLELHPYDLSGGEQQRAALAKVLLKSPEILLLDEPTKGMDAHFKRIFAQILNDLKENGLTVIMVSHDIEFCAEYSDRCGMLFDGSIVSCGAQREFFAGKNFYTTSANRMARTTIPEAVLAEDIILACGGEIQERVDIERKITYTKNEVDANEIVIKRKKLTPARIIFGCLFALLFVLTLVVQNSDVDVFNFPAVSGYESVILQLISILEITAAIFCFIPKRSTGTEIIEQPKEKQRLTKRTILATLFVLVMIPLTIYTGVFYLEDKKYYLISLLVIAETIIPFLAVFESKKPQARELITISVICAIAVGGRIAFYMLPQFKPVLALVIIAGICFGGETGFLVGVITAFVSNFYFGQGPWTPWQMFSYGIVGFVAGVLFNKGFITRTKLSLSVFGAISTLLLCGVIMNCGTVIMYQPNPTLEMFIVACIAGVPFDLVHAVSTAFFLWFISEPMIEKIERVKIKYGLQNK